MPVVSEYKNGLMSKDEFYLRGRIGKAVDFNNYTKSGYYTVGIGGQDISTVKNFPIGVYGYGILLIFSSYDGAICQLYIPHQYNAMCTRMSFNKGVAWSEWLELVKKPQVKTLKEAEINTEIEEANKRMIEQEARIAKLEGK